MALTGYEIVYEQTDLTANSYSAGDRPSCIAYCPEGKLILGGGALGYGGIAVLVDTHPSGVDAMTSWTSVFEIKADVTSFPAIGLGTYLICANAEDE